MKYIRITTTLLFVAVLGIFITAPTMYMQSFIDGITVWAYNVLPAIFPFMVLTTLMLKIQGRRKRSFTKFLFELDCDSVFLASILCGYPIGAKAISDSCADEATAAKACSFCSSAGPIFIIATVGAKLLQNTTATIILVAVHYISLILNGLIYRKYKTTMSLNTSSNFKASDVGDTVTNSALSVITVGGLIALFYMLTDMVKSILPLSVSNCLAVSFILGIFEMTNGIFGICNSTDVATATVLCSSLLALGGLCVFAQCYAFLGKKNVKPLSIIKMKITQAAIATILSFILVKLFM